MKKSLFLIAAMLASALSQAAHATVVTFDDLPDGMVPDGYGGIIWGGNWTAYSFEQDPYSPHSNPSRAYNSGPLPEFEFAAPVRFLGAFFASYDSETIQFALYDAGLLVGTSSVISTSQTSTFLSSGFSGLVDRVAVITNYPGPYYAMDDVTYTPAPEPAIWGMMAFGLGAVGGAMRRRARITFTHA